MMFGFVMVTVWLMLGYDTAYAPVARRHPAARSATPAIMMVLSVIETTACSAEHKTGSGAEKLPELEDDHWKWRMACASTS